MFSPKARGSDLRRFELFADCDPAELACVDSLSTRLRIGTGRVLLRRGGAERQLLLIVAGEAEDGPGHGSTLAVLGLVDFLVEMAMLTGEPPYASAPDLTPLEVLV